MQASLKDILMPFVDDCVEENDFFEEDDIDRLFQHLEQVEPPTALLEQTFSLIYSLPEALRYTR